MNPEQHENTVKDFDPTITLFHVGGRGPSMGPIAHLLTLRQDMEMLIFEADLDGSKEEEDWESPIWKFAQTYNMKLSIISKCLSNCVGKKTFHINVMPECSSLLRIGRNAGKLQRLHEDYRIQWGQICQPAHSVELDVTTLDKLYEDDVTGLPDFLSVDVQGAEYDILEGASEALNGDLTGVMTEVEFTELYDGQKLFTDQCALLDKHRFKLIHLYNQEYWYPGPIFDKGHLTVAEALFLRDYRYFVEKYDQPKPLLQSLAKLAVVASCFKRTSYAFEIVEYMMDNWSKEWDTLVAQTTCEYLKNFTAFYAEGKALQREQKESVPDYFEYVQKKTEQTSSRKSVEQL